MPVNDKLLIEKKLFYIRYANTGRVEICHILYENLVMLMERHSGHGTTNHEAFVLK